MRGMEVEEGGKEVRGVGPFMTILNWRFED